MSGLLRKAYFQVIELAPKGSIAHPVNRWEENKSIVD